MAGSPGVILESAQQADGGSFLHFRDALGRRCAVYARLAIPSGAGPFAAVIHCPGGGQTINDGDLAFWTSHGFACASFDWQHGLYDGHDPARKSQWPQGVVAQGEGCQRTHQLILPLAVRAVSAVIDWLERDQRIDRSCIGITGISWGGYLTWVANAHEPRLRAAVPVYGCGGVLDRGHPYLPRLPAHIRRAWLTDWEPSRLAQRQRSPVCFLSGSDDFFGWPRHGDRLLDALSVPSRRSYAANLDHAVEPSQSALAVAWMDRWLRGGPALPPAPQPGDVGTTWWTCSTGDDDHHCWWPGRAPAWATARFVQTTHGAMMLSSTVERLTPRRGGSPLPAIWPDIRAGVGWNWGLSTTQLHGNHGVGIKPLPGDPTRGVVTGNREGELAVILRMTADPRWNRPGFTGLRVRIAGLSRTPRQLHALFRLAGPGRRREVWLAVNMDAAGWVDIDRLPDGASWTEATRIDLCGIPGRSFILGPIVATGPGRTPPVARRRS